MRISDTERREVARRLREMSETESVAAMLDLDDDVRTEMTLRVIRAIVGKGDIFEKLADLIDRPTTHIGVNEHGRACCINCGYDDWCLADGSRYCPNCGAEVVS